MGTARFKPVVKQDPDAPVEREVLAQAILKVSDAMATLTASGLNQRAIIVLLADLTGVGKREIKSVLDGLAALTSAYCR